MNAWKSFGRVFWCVVHCPHAGSQAGSQVSSVAGLGVTHNKQTRSLKKTLFTIAQVLMYPPGRTPPAPPRPIGTTHPLSTIYASLHTFRHAKGRTKKNVKICEECNGVINMGREFDKWKEKENKLDSELNCKHVLQHTYSIRTRKIMSMTHAYTHGKEK